MKNIAIVFTLALLTGCTTLHFDNGSDPGTLQIEKWHHNFVLALYEGSSPINLENECGDREWNSVKTELSLVNGVVTIVASLLGPIWYPKTVTISCK